MNITKHIIVFLIVLFLKQPILAQNIENQSEELSVLFEKLRLTNEDAQKDSLNDIILNSFEKILKQEKSFYHSFSRLNSVGIINSQDGLLRLFNWNVFYSNGTNKYFAFVQHKKKRRKAHKLYRLSDTGNLVAGNSNEVLPNSKWYGCLYYSIKEVKVGKNKTYMLMGWDAANDFSNKKVLDVLYFSRRKLFLGKPIISYKKQIVSRLVFEYAEQAQMLLRYDDKYNMIIWDHLSPSESSLKGQYEYYGPDGTYDGLRFERNKWIFYPNIKPLNER